MRVRVPLKSDGNGGQLIEITNKDLKWLCPLLVVIISTIAMLIDYGRRVDNCMKMVIPNIEQRVTDLEVDSETGWMLQKEVLRAVAPDKAESKIKDIEEYRGRLKHKDRTVEEKKSP